MVELLVMPHVEPVPQLVGIETDTCTLLVTMAPLPSLPVTLIAKVPLDENIVLKVGPVPEEGEPPVAVQEKATGDVPPVAAAVQLKVELEDEEEQFSVTTSARGVMVIGKLWTDVETVLASLALAVML